MKAVALGGDSEERKTAERRSRRQRMPVDRRAGFTAGKQHGRAEAARVQTPGKLPGRVELARLWPEPIEALDECVARVTSCDAVPLQLLRHERAPQSGEVGSRQAVRRRLVPRVGRRL